MKLLKHGHLELESNIKQADSAYVGGTFSLAIHFPPRSYPLLPPKVSFTTRIYHLNVYEDGTVSTDMLGRSWSPQLTIMRGIYTPYSMHTRAD